MTEQPIDAKTVLDFPSGIMCDCGHAAWEHSACCFECSCMETVDAVMKVGYRRSLAASQARVEPLDGFWRDMVQVFGFDGSLNLDGGDFEEIAEKHGLIKWITYKPDDFTEEEREHIEVEPGDLMWVDNLAALASAPDAPSDAPDAASPRQGLAARFPWLRQGLEGGSDG